MPDTEARQAAFFLRPSSVDPAKAAWTTQRGSKPLVDSRRLRQRIADDVVAAMLGDFDDQVRRARAPWTFPNQIARYWLAFVAYRERSDDRRIRTDGYGAPASSIRSLAAFQEVSSWSPIS